jgi:hypothetical protein
MNNDDDIPLILIWVFAAFCMMTIYGITYLAFLL